jgi:hypothetical protein
MSNYEFPDFAESNKKKVDGKDTPEKGKWVKGQGNPPFPLGFSLSPLPLVFCFRSRFFAAFRAKLRRHSFG